MMTNSEVLQAAMQQFAWSNIRSAKTAIKAGFCPGWVEMTVKSAEVVDEMNK